MSDIQGGKSGSRENQRELCRDVCDDEGFELTREYNTCEDLRLRDGAASENATKRRLWWEQLVADILSGAEDGNELPDVLVLDEVARADRVPERWLIFLRVLADLGIKVSSSPRTSGTASGNVFGNLPIVASPQLTAGTAILGDWRSARLIVREEARIDLVLQRHL